MGRRASRSKLVSLVLLFAGIAVLLYPVVATQYNNFHQQAFSKKYADEVAASDPTTATTELAAARSYNETLDGVPILDPWLNQADGDPGSTAYQEYRSQLSRFDAMARLRIPDADIDLPVYHGTSDEVLSRGVGHLYGTSLPVGGEGSHAVLTSHTGLANATLFDHLTSLEVGDLIFVDVLGETLAYRVDQIKVVLPDQISDLAAVPGKDYLTVFTCTPYAINTHRLLVRGVRIPYDASLEVSSTDDSDITIETWMWLLVGAAVAAVISFMVIARRGTRWRRPGRTRASETAASPQGFPRRAAGRVEETAVTDSFSDEVKPE